MKTPLRKFLAPILLTTAVVAARAAPAQLYVLSQQTQEVLTFDENTGAFEDVFATSVTVGFRIPVGIALRPTDGSLYVSSVSTGEIWSYTTATGVPATAHQIRDLITQTTSGTLRHRVPREVRDEVCRYAVRRRKAGPGR